MIVESEFFLICNTDKWEANSLSWLFFPSHLKTDNDEDSLDLSSARLKGRKVPPEKPK